MQDVRMGLNEKGFTLIEIMVVVIIISILIMIAIPVYNITRANAQEKTCQANQRIVEGAAVMWYMAAPGRDMANVTLGNLEPYWQSEVAPLCPLGNRQYRLDAGRVSCPYDHPHY